MKWKLVSNHRASQASFSISMYTMIWKELGELRVAKNTCNRSTMIWKELGDFVLPKIYVTKPQWYEKSLVTPVAKNRCNRSIMIWKELSDFTNCQKYVQPKHSEIKELNDFVLPKICATETKCESMFYKLCFNYFNFSINTGIFGFTLAIILERGFAIQLWQNQHHLRQHIGERIHHWCHP
jgi:hypothetical protein